VTFCGDHERVFGLSAESFGERALIVGRISTSNPNLAKVGAGDAERASLRVRPPTRSRPSLAAVVEQILSGQPAPGMPSRNAPSGEHSAQRGAETPPAQPVITTVTGTSTANKDDPAPRGGRRSSTG
jgi:hypothetical protein